MRLKIFAFIHIATLLLSFSIHAHSIFIVVHGTWSSNAAWYMPGGDFFDTLEQTAQQYNAPITSFRWCGSNNDNARQQAAHNLIKLIKTYDPATDIYLVGHSHGGNVCILASQLLAQDPTNLHRIQILFALGTPTRKSLYPDMNIIKYFYNLFSFEDLIQPVCAIFEREYPTHERIANMRVFINGKQPDHSTLHHSLVGKWLPSLHEHFIHYLQTHYKTKNMSLPSIVYLADNENPAYEHDTQRKELIERDLKLSFMILNALRTNKAHLQHS